MSLVQRLTISLLPLDAIDAFQAATHRGCLDCVPVIFQGNVDLATLTRTERLEPVQ